MTSCSYRLPFVVIVSLALCGIIWESITVPNFFPNDQWLADKVFRKKTAHDLQRQEMRRRKSRVERVCKSMNYSYRSQSDSRPRFLIHRPKKLAFCYVAKAGCTFWKRVFLSLQAQQKDKELLFKVHKKFIHHRTTDTLDQFQFDQAHRFLDSATKIVFVRSPYSRLFSAYVDKFVLSDLWHALGRRVVKRFRENPDPVAMECGHDVRFEEFLRFVLTVPCDGLRHFIHEHWCPVSQLCDPCSLNFDFVGKQETFAADLDFIAAEVDIRWALPVDTSASARAMSSMTQSTSLMWFNTLKSDTACRNSTNVSKRLLQAFAAQGFLSPDVSVPWPSNETFTSAKFLRFIEHAYKAQNLSRTEYHKRRQTALQSAYHAVPKEVVKKIKEMFKLDFNLFGYDPSPKEIFN